MYREAIAKLEKWKNSGYRKPLILRGARQVGKTWLMREFGKNNYKKCAYISMDENERMENVFREAFDIERILLALEIEVGFKITPEDTLIIFDEIQEIPRALKALKYFYEQAPQYHVMAAGSLLGIALHEGTSFPVGKVDFCNLYPMTFREFLRACGQDRFVDLMDSQDFAMLSNFKSKIADYLRTYYFVGGMPEAVETYVETKDFDEVRAVQNRLLMAYENDLSKHAPAEIVTKTRMVWNSIPTQLSRENKKFVFGRVNKPDFPLRAYQDFSAFKMFVLDIGLLGAMSRLNKRILLEGDRLFEEFKGALTEQYVLQQLVVHEENDIFYWSAERGTGEIDFLVQMDDKIIPIEVKAEENLQAKSLRTFVQKYNMKYAVRTSMSDYREQDWMVNIPLYYVGNLNQYYQDADCK